MSDEELTPCYRITSVWNANVGTGTFAQVVLAAIDNVRTFFKNTEHSADKLVQTGNMVWVDAPLNQGKSGDMGYLANADHSPLLLSQIERR